jgi:hypothetical protein
MARHELQLVEPDADADAEGARGRATEEMRIHNRICIALAEAADDIREATDALTLEAEAMRMALDAMLRIKATSLACSERLLKSGITEGGERQLMIESIAKPLGLASSATLAVNASIASSSNALAEASLRIIRAGELFLEASRIAACADGQPGERRSGGKAQGALASRALL